MESAAPSVRFVTYSKVLDVRERSKAIYLSGYGKDTNYKTESLGYFVLLEGSHEAIHLGAEPPELKVGDRVKITIEKEPTK